MRELSKVELGQVSGGWGSCQPPKDKPKDCKPKHHKHHHQPKCMKPPKCAKPDPVSAD